MVCHFLVDVEFVAYRSIVIGLLCLVGGALMSVSFVIFFETHLRETFVVPVTTTAPVESPVGGLCGRGYCQRPPAQTSDLPQLAFTQPLSQGTTTVAFVGDMMFDRVVADRSRIAHTYTYPFVRIGNLKRAFEADAVIANLEGPVGATRRVPVKSIDFLFDPLVIDVLKQEGIDAVSQANNHSLDQGRLGAEESRDRLQRGGLIVFGDQVNDYATSSLAMLQVRDRALALLGFNVTDNPLDHADALQAITAAQASASTTIVFMHWGQEYRDHPTVQQTELAHWFIDHGVQAVIGSHPHWVQSVEVYQGRPIVYSLGNFVFDQDWSTETQQGLVVTLGMSADAMMLRFIPIEVVKSQPYILQDAARVSRLKHLASISDPILTEQILSGQLRLLP